MYKLGVKESRIILLNGSNQSVFAVLLALQTNCKKMQDYFVYPAYIVLHHLEDLKRQIYMSILL